MSKENFIPGWEGIPLDSAVAIALDQLDNASEAEAETRIQKVLDELDSSEERHE